MTDVPFLPGDEWGQPEQTKEERKASIVKAAKANHQIAFVMSSGAVAALSQLMSSAMVAGGLTRSQREFATSIHDDLQKRLLASLATEDDTVKTAVSGMVDAAGLPVLLEGNEFHLEDYPREAMKFSLRWAPSGRFLAANMIWDLIRRASDAGHHIPPGIVSWLTNARVGSRAEWTDPDHGTVKASVDAA